jgi:hypothetical protein
MPSIAAMRKKRKCTSKVYAKQRGIVKPSAAIKKARQESAFVHLTELRKHNTRNTLNHDISMIVIAHNDHYVTKSSLNYMLRKHMKAAATAVAIAPADAALVVPEVQNDNAAHTRVVNVALPVLEVNFDATDNSISDMSKASTDSASTTSTPSSLERWENHTFDTTRLINLCTTIAAQLYNDERVAAQEENKIVSPNTLKDIIKEVEMEYKLCRGTLKPRTIRGRVYSGNLTGFHTNSTSALFGLEQFIVAMCLQLSKFGEPLSKNEIIELVKSASKGTEYARRYNARQNIPRPPSIKPEDEVACIGNGWYRGFRKRHASHLKNCDVKVSVPKRLSPNITVPRTFVESEAAKTVDVEVM